MAVTTLQAMTVINAPAPNPFLLRVQMALVTIAENVSSEATNTPLHAQRKQLAAQIMNNPSQFVYNFAQAVVANLTLSAANLVTVTGFTSQDLDTTDAALQTSISSVYNDFFV